MDGRRVESALSGQKPNIEDPALSGQSVRHLRMSWPGQGHNHDRLYDLHEEGVEADYIKQIWKDLLYSIRVWLIVTCIPGHCGITQNERAGKITSKVQPFPELQRESDNVLPEVERRERNEIPRAPETSMGHLKARGERMAIWREKHK